MKLLKYLVPLFFLIFLLASSIFATKGIMPVVSGSGFLNGNDIDAAQNRVTAIHITNPQVSFRGEITNSTGTTLNISKVEASVGFFFSKEFSFEESVSPGETKSKTISATIPSWVFSTFKGYYTVTANLLNAAGNVVLTKNFMVFIGKGSPLASVPGAVGAAAGAVAVTTAIGVIRGAKPPKPGKDDKPRRSRNIMRGISTFAMILSVLLLFMLLGLINFSSGLVGFLVFGAAAGISWNLLIQILLVVF